LRWFWNICLLISVMSLLSSGFLSTQLLFILCPMSQFLEQEWTLLFISSCLLNSQYFMVFLFSTLCYSWRWKVAYFILCWFASCIMVNGCIIFTFLLTCWLGQRGWRGEFWLANLLLKYYFIIDFRQGYDCPEFLHSSFYPEQGLCLSRSCVFGTACIASSDYSLHLCSLY
jgi:hypothetical protein